VEQRMSKSHQTIEELERVAADHELVGELALDRETRRRNKLGARKVRKLVDRLAHKRELVRLERNIALGGPRISHQKGLIARIERLGTDSRRARELLGVFEETQALFEEYRARLLRKM
jgi:hypothetical protein